MPFQRTTQQTARARTFRQQENPAEASMWTVLQNRQLGGHKFVRQWPIGVYFADFVCRAEKLVVEIDGSQHVNSDHDQRRDLFLARQGYAILRIPSARVLRHRSEVCDAILAALAGEFREDVDTIELKFIRPSSVSGCALATFSRKREK